MRLSIMKIYIQILISILFISGIFYLLVLINQVQTLTFWKIQSVYFFSKMFNTTTSKYVLPSIETPCPIFTYYQPLVNLVDLTLLKQLEIWGYAFYAHGFRPVIINRTSAQTRANFTELLYKFSQFSTVNPAEYELNCYIRWLALVEQNGGLLMDYDILPMTSSQSTQMRELKECKWNQLTTYASMYPMVTHGNVSAIEKWIQYMLNFNKSNFIKINGKPHISDMLMAIHAINHNHGIFIVKPSLPFFHYSHHARDTVFRHIKHSTTEIMTRNQHLYHFLHHNIYLPILPSISPYSVQIVRSLTLCPDVILPYDEIDLFCRNKNISADICKMITVNGFWIHNDPENGKCRWKTGHPNDENQWGIPENSVYDREPFIIAVLPQPEVYLCRRWLYENPLHLSNIACKTQEFHSWASLQSTSIMLDTLIPQKSNIDIRITRIINAMRLGQALVMTEKFITQLHQTEGKEGIEKWMSSHVGFFLNITEPNIDWEMKQFLDTDSKFSIGEDHRFYSAIEDENNRWTKDWHNWRRTFLPLK